VVDEAWRQFEVGRLSEREFCRHLRRQARLSLTDDELIHGWNSVYLGTNSDVEALLCHVAGHGVRVVAVTNTNASHQRVWEERFAASVSFFAAVYSSWQMGTRKPEPAFFRHVLRSEGIAPDQALFIDDLVVNVDAARRLGMDVIRYTCAGGLRDALTSRGLLRTNSPA
jgi:HAD superfamily hydrolase (TIGR01509 family)